MNDERTTRDIVVREYVVSCCEPLGHPTSAWLWALALIVVGGVWLAANVLSLDNWGQWLVPALLVAWGAALLIGVVRRPVASASRES